VKTRQPVINGFFHAESVGLEALRTNTSLRVPKVIRYEDDFILLEDLGNTKPRPDFQTTLGEGLAQLHAATQQEFGFSMPTFCGPSEQSNTPCSDGYEFFAEQRLLNMAARVFDEGILKRVWIKRIEYIATNLSRWIPPQEPAQLHGDLWGGNAHSDENGEPCLIDPACYWGWPESDLAMTDLFGGFTEDFYQAYLECRPLEPGWRERFPLYNLYHLLNHVLLFGTRYLGPVEVICMDFAGDAGY
jgi:fructosamine-3-kinase